MNARQKEVDFDFSPSFHKEYISNFKFKLFAHLLQTWGHFSPTAQPAEGEMVKDPRYVKQPVYSVRDTARLPQQPTPISLRDLAIPHLIKDIHQVNHHRHHDQVILLRAKILCCLMATPFSPLIMVRNVAFKRFLSYLSACLFA
jgi:hypothetical protein